MTGVKLFFTFSLFCQVTFMLILKFLLHSYYIYVYIEKNILRPPLSVSLVLMEHLILFVMCDTDLRS